MKMGTVIRTIPRAGAPVMPRCASTALPQFMKQWAGPVS